MRKLKTTEIKSTREQILLSQGGICAMCNQVIVAPCLDHNHQTGVVRGVACRSCNALEGKIVNAAKRMGVKDLESFLSGLMAYHKTHSTDQTSLLHPTFKTPEDRKLLASKRRKAKLKTKAL